MKEGSSHPLPSTVLSDLCHGGSMCEDKWEELWEKSTVMERPEGHRWKLLYRLPWCNFSVPQEQSRGTRKIELSEEYRSHLTNSFFSVSCTSLQWWWLWYVQIFLLGILISWGELYSLLPSLPWMQKKQSRQKWLRVALHRQKLLHNKFCSGLGSASREGALAETVILLSSLVIQLAPYPHCHGTEICLSAVFTATFGFTQTFPHSAWSCSDPWGSKASCCLPWQLSNCMHAKDTNKRSEGVLWFPVIGVVRVTQCVFTWSRQKFQGGFADMNCCPFKEKRQEAQAC